MVVGVEAGVLEAFCLGLAQQTQRAANLQAHGRHLAHHLQDPIELRTVAHFAPRRAQANAAYAPLPRPARDGHDRFLVHHALRFDPRVIAGRLRAIDAVLGTTSGLD